MNRKQNNLLNMIRTVVAVCEQYQSVVMLVPAFKAIFDLLKTKLAEILIVAQRQETITKGITQDKAKLKSNLAKVASTFSSVLQGYASMKDNNKLLQEIKFTESTLKTISDEKLVLYSELILEKTILHATDLKNSGITEAMTVTFRQLITDYKNNMSAPTLALNQREAHTDNLDTLITEVNDMLKLQLDKTGKIFSTLNPEFYTLYSNARKVRASSGNKDTSATISGVVKNSDGQLLSGVLVELPEYELLMVTHTDGSYSFSDLEEGTYSLRFSRAGYETLVLEDIDVFANDELVKDVVLKLGK